MAIIEIIEDEEKNINAVIKNRLKKSLREGVTKQDYESYKQTRAKVKEEKSEKNKSR